MSASDARRALEKLTNAGEWKIDRVEMEVVNDERIRVFVDATRRKPMTWADRWRLWRETRPQ